MKIVDVGLDAAARAAWEGAQALWGVRMHDPQLLPGAGRAQGAPAWFSFPPAIAVDPRYVARLGAAAELESVFAHELGHHVLAPSTRVDSLKIRHQLARALAASAGAGAEASGGAFTERLGMLANLWNDLLVNVRVGQLQRRRDAAQHRTEAGIVRVSRALYGPSHDTQDRLWWVYLRAYELLWDLPPGALCSVAPPAPPTPPTDNGARRGPAPDVPERFRDKERVLRAAQEEAERVERELRQLTRTRPELDAGLVAELVRTFAADPVGGALRFGLIAWPYLLEAGAASTRERAAAGCAADDSPATPEELGRVMADPRLREPVPDTALPFPSRGAREGSGDRSGHGQGLGLARTLALYGDSAADAVMAAWYRSEASPWVRPLRRRQRAAPAPDLPGPLELWDNGDDTAEIDWSATLQVAPVVLPGVTTRRRTFLVDDPEVAEAPVEVDIYIDSSGSMPNPRTGSPAVLAGMIVALSVLRGGGRVRATSFSGPGQVGGTERFTRDDAAIVTALATYFGGGTSFPLDLFRDRYERARPGDGVVRHVVVLSDDGLVSMFGVGNEPFASVAAQVRPRLATASLVLQDRAKRVAPLAAAAGYDVAYIESMDEAPAACARLARVLQETEDR
jgi:hypothetical protein